MATRTYTAGNGSVMSCGDNVDLQPNHGLARTLAREVHGKP
nr:hypothetical protein [Candidatus Sigynarchaeota archaeon]